MSRSLAIFRPGGNFGTPENLFGADVANAGLFQALARHGGFETLHLLGLEAPGDAAIAEGFPAQARTRILGGEIMAQQACVAAGTLLRGGPDLSNLAWLRRRAAGDAGYSLAGLIHTIAPPTMRQMIADAAIAPVQPWDALICTSPSVQAALTRLFDEWGGYLADRFGGSARPRPSLPLIPLGVDVPALVARADRPQARADIRSRLGVAEEDVLILWIGRLSFFEKAFPQPMFRAVAEAAAATGAGVHFALAGWFPNGEADRARYEQAARAYAPNAPVHFVDGADQDQVGKLWAGADVFLSLVDNIQETFGITPIEAMAAGLPVVASDWDGYRSTVRDRIDGFLIPTLGGVPGGLGHSMSLRHLMQLDTYQAYVGEVAQHTAVHVGQAAEALAALIRSPDLRRTLGRNGRARAKAAFDWPVIVDAYLALFDDLAAIRGAAPQGPRTLHPARGDPFDDFAGFATRALALDAPLALRPGAGLQDLKRAAEVELDQMFGGWRAGLEECEQALAVIAQGGATVRSVLTAFPVPRRRAVEMALVWMAKLGIVDWLA